MKYESKIQERELKALRLIEEMCLEYGDDPPILQDIYKVAHCFSYTCCNPHLDWQEELDNRLKDI